VRLLHGAGTVGLTGALAVRTKLFGGQVLVNERIVEYPQILRWLQPPCAVLDIGCVSSRLPIQLASLGYTVHGLDVRPYGFSHPNFTFHQTDLFRWTPPRLFDTILLVSTIEHFGIGGYGDAKLNEADMEAIKKIAEWLAPGGQLLVSLPYGKAAITPKHRIYDQVRLARLFQSFEWVEQAYFQRIDGAWQPSDPVALQEVASPALPPNGVAVLHFRAKQV
jgi:SAM-dependent methyltransferase